MIESGLRSYLINHPSVGSLVGTRVYPLTLPQGVVLPAITYQQISGPREQAYDGPSALAHPRFQLDCWAETYGEAVGLARAVRQALDGYQGLMGGVAVRDVVIDNELDGYEPETALWRRTIDVIVWHEDA